MNDKLDSTIQNLQQVANTTRSTFGLLSHLQLNWKPAAKSWSVAQCFDHLITTHSLYFPSLERLATAKEQMSFWQRMSPLSGFFGRFLIKSLDPQNLKKISTTGKAFPSESEIDSSIIERFCEHQDQLIDHLKKLPKDLDAEETIITSPLLGIVTYSLADTFTILDVHCRRHFNQAVRVTQVNGFPMEQGGI